jgi:hypothetical protein
MTMAPGIICMKVYQHINRHVKAYDIMQELAEANSNHTTSLNTASIVVGKQPDGESKGGDALAGVEGGNHQAATNTAPRTVSWGVLGGNERPQPTHVWLKYLHGFFMFYSFVMILGAAGAFGSNARTQYPYQKGDETDMLIGRCYGRNLANSTGAPSWLSNLNCGLGAWCNVQSATNSGTNPYSKNPY